MARRRFDAQTRYLLNEIQSCISEINGKLLNPTVADRTKLEAERNALRLAAKAKKQEFYKESNQRLFEKIGNLKLRINNYSASSITKQ